MGEDRKQEVYSVGLQEYEVSDVQIVRYLSRKGTLKGAQGQLEQMGSHLDHMLSYNLLERNIVLSLILLAVKEAQTPQTMTARQGENAL
ncbi:unnamed protein product [Brassica rapa]|uniref:Uncharacterized protein n=1 Tax=Brassica campestris TaxID=3711 RepID=A0A8D9GCI5_BRACM|nr:unnamed protein product [Brassica rapa]